MTKPVRGPRKGSETFTVEGAGWLYRRPVLHHGRWRVSRRNLRSNAIETLTLDGESLKACKREVAALAERERIDAAEAEKNPEDRQPAGITVADALAEWAGGFDVKPTTAEDYRLSVKKYETVLGPLRLVSEVTLRDLESLFFERWAGSSGRTKLKHLAMLKRFWNWCLRHGHAKVIVPALLEIPRKWRQDAQSAIHEAGRALAVEECRALVAAARSHVHQAVAIALLSGLRLGNIIGPCAIRWGDVDLKHGEETLTIDGDRMKGGRQFRVPLNCELAALLRDLQRALGRIPGRHDRIIPVIGELKNGFNGAVSRAGIKEHLRFHDLRHTYCALLARTAPYAVLMRLMGHAPSKSVTDRYAKGVSFEDLRKHADGLPRLLSSADTPGQAQKKLT